jgi:hypothetical protein
MSKRRKKNLDPGMDKKKQTKSMKKMRQIKIPRFLPDVYEY